MAKLKIKDITKLKYSDYAKFDEDKLLKYAKQALSYSIAGAKSAQEALKKHPDLPVPIEYRKAEAKTVIDVLRDEFEGKDLSKMHISQVRRALRLSIGFLNTKTRTIKGWKEYLNNFVERIGEKANIVINKQDYKRYWDLYNKVLKINPIEGYRQGGSTEVQRMLIDTITQVGKNATDEDLLEFIANNLEVEYIKRQQKGMDIDDELFEMFDLGENDTYNR